MKKVFTPRLKTLLWDVDIDKISINDHAKFIIERVLEYGDKEEFLWLKKTYSVEQIVETIKKSKRLSAKTVNLFAKIYNISLEEIECFQNPYTQKQNRF